jgi:cytochrome c
VSPRKYVRLRFPEVERNPLRKEMPGTFLLCFAIVLLLPTGAPAGQGAGASDLFKAKCAVCHGPDGSGNTAVGKRVKMRDLRSDEVQKQSDSKLAEITNCGVGQMPAFQDRLSDEQIHSLVIRMRELAKQK